MTIETNKWRIDSSDPFEHLPIRCLEYGILHNIQNYIQVPADGYSWEWTILRENLEWAYRLEHDFDKKTLIALMIKQVIEYVARGGGHYLRIANMQNAIIELYTSEISQQDLAA